MSQARQQLSRIRQGAGHGDQPQLGQEPRLVRLPRKSTWRAIMPPARPAFSASQRIPRSSASKGAERPADPEPLLIPACLDLGPQGRDFALAAGPGALGVVQPPRQEPDLVFQTRRAGGRGGILDRLGGCAIVGSHLAASVTTGRASVAAGHIVSGRHGPTSPRAARLADDARRTGGAAGSPRVAAAAAVDRDRHRPGRQPQP